MTATADTQALDLLFREARTYSKWRDQKVSDALLRRAWDLARLGPTSANGQPGRVVFVKSPEAKELLKPALGPNNVAKTMAAPVTAIIAQDHAFYELLPRLYPHVDAKGWLAGNEALIESTAFRNGTLLGGYFILAVRSLGLDCGPMSGFDNAKVDEAFFAGTTIRSNFLINIGYGDPAGLHPRNPRLGFDEACKIV